MRMKAPALALLSALLLSACSPGTVVKGNMYRMGFKQGKVNDLLARFEKGTYAIFPFKGIVEGRTTGIATDGNAIADLLSIQMLYHGYKVLERDKMEKLLDEKAFKETDLAAPTPDSALAQGNPKPGKPSGRDEQNILQAVKMGKMLGVDFVVCGSVVQYEFQLGNGGKVALAVTITARILDVETGDIIFAMSAGSNGNNLPEALDGITLAFTDALKEGKVYVWE